MLVVFASGSGSNFESLATKLPVSLLVCDKEDAGVLERARRLGIKNAVVPKLKGESREQHEKKILEILANETFSMILLAGYYRLLSPSFLQHFAPGTVINIHPALLPLHPGLKGYEDTFASGLEGGISIHEVDEGMDTGKMIVQEKFPRLPSDDFETFRARGLKLEHELYAKTVRTILDTKYVSRLEVLPKAKSLVEDPSVLKGRVYWLESQGPLGSKALELSNFLADPVSEKAFWREGADYQSHVANLGFKMPFEERGFHPGVTDNPADAARVGMDFSKISGISEIRSGESLRGEAARVPFNALLQWKTSRVSDYFETAPFAMPAPSPSIVKNYNLDVPEAELERMNQDNWWALSSDELQLVRQYFTSRGTGPTDVEMEVIAQTWSEHCKHKIFRAEIDFTDEDTGDKRQVSSLFKTFIKGVTDDVRKDRGLDWLISVFDDNAGIVRWDSKLDVAIKVETHNSPSALDPYGGALTGILGVNRDILGAGMGARPIANTNVFCLAPENLDKALGDKWPSSLLAPARIRQGVHAGVKDGGNKSGIPTVNGAFHYDVNFSGKPLVFCGTLGVIPRMVPTGESHLKPVKPGDHVVMVGGRIGKDGLHGATFSSLEWKEGTPASVVQIGDPFTQKRVMDFILKAQELGIYSGITDNGAGGLSSSVGEMSTFTGGAEIDLALAPTKYPGLAPWELMVSESQERMTVAVPPQHLAAFLKLAGEFAVEATNLGKFTNDGMLRVNFDGKSVAILPLNFLHEGLPAMKLKARFGKTHAWSDWCEQPIIKRPLGVLSGTAIETVLKELLSHPNIRSHESWVRQYDHEVQAASALKPFTPSGLPSDAGVIAMKSHGGDEFTGLAVSTGLAPQLSRVDPWLMAVASVDEAVRNAVCTGADPARMAMVDNFCWPDPIETAKNLGGDVKLGMLVRTCEGMASACKAMGLPLVSGKDSMKNDAKGTDQNGNAFKISALPTLLMTAMSHVPDIRRVLPSSPNQAGLKVVVLEAAPERWAFTLSQNFQFEPTIPSAPELKTLAAFYQDFHRAHVDRLFESAHDVSEGGVLVALSEMAMGETGLNVTMESEWEKIFGEGLGKIIVTCAADKLSELQKRFSNASVLGVTTKGGGLKLETHDAKLELKNTDLLQAFRRSV